MAQVISLPLLREEISVSYRVSSISCICLAALAAFTLAGLNPKVRADEPVPGTDPKLRGSGGIVADANLAGTWNLIRSVNQGKKSDQEETRGSEVIVRENEMSVFDADKNELYRCEFKFDTTSEPYTITMKSTTPGRPAAMALGIYRLEDNKWTLCYALPGNQRPKKFKSTKEDHTMLMVMKRPK